MLLLIEKLKKGLSITQIKKHEQAAILVDDVPNKHLIITIVRKMFKNKEFLCT